MLISQVQIGMRLIADEKRFPWTSHWEHNRIIEVVDLVPGGFIYNFEDGESRLLHARMGVIVAPYGHTHYGVNGICMFRLATPDDEPYSVGLTH